MSSVPPAAYDSWDDLLPTVPSPAVSQGSGTSGESFVVVDEEGAGGGAKLSLFFTGTSAGEREPCLGCVGTGRVQPAKFCLKPCLFTGACATKSHEVTKFSVQPDSYYVRASVSSAFCAPVLGAEWQTSPLQHTKMMQQKLTMLEWDALFKCVIQGGELPEWLNPEGRVDNADERVGKPSLVVQVNQDLAQADLEVVSPLRMFEKMGIFQNLPKMTPEVDSEEEGSSEPRDWEAEVPVQVVRALSKLQRRIRKVEDAWAPAFQEVEMSYVEIVEDIRKMQVVGQQLQVAVGVPTARWRSTPVWQAVSELQFGAETGEQEFRNLQSTVLQARKEFVQTQEAIEELKEWLTGYGSRLEVAEASLTMHDRRFNNIRPAVAAIKGLLEREAPGGSSPANDAKVTQQLLRVQTELQDLRLKVAAGNDPTWSGLGGSAGGGEQLEAEVRDMRAKLKLLEQRVVGDGVQIGSKVFQCFEDLQAWSKTELPNGRYGLFVDAVSLLDFFAFTGFTESEKSIAAMHNSQKTGFTTMYEARAAATLQNVFPLILGKTAAGGMDDSEYLPAIVDPDKWDNGVTGIKHQIARSMGDVEYQLETAVDSAFRDYPDTRQIARDCLYGAKRFVTDLCIFMTDDYSRWKRQGHSKKEAWKITSVCVRRVFEEMFSVRVVARDVRDASDSNYTSAKILWAIFKSQEIMRAYVKHQFTEHPSVNAVISRHLAANYVKPDEEAGSKIALLESKLKALTTRLDRMEAKASPGGGKQKKKGEE